jgi:Putative DNA-binding domain
LVNKRGNEKTHKQLILIFKQSKIQGLEEIIGGKALRDIEWLIRYEREGTTLDFKKEQYHKEKYQDLIKDIISMANAPVEGKRYIVVGVKDKPDGTKEFFSIPREEFVDQATYQQIVRENVEPNIDFSYYPIELDGNLLGIFEIDKCNNPPYMMKKDYRTLKKGECFVRKGSQQERMTRRDLDEILQFKSSFYFNDKILVGFNKNLDQKLTVKGVREVNLPSEEARKKIERILKEREMKGKLGFESPIKRLSLHMPSFRSPFESVPYEERSTEELRENLKKVKETYKDDDCYYIGEKISKRINLTLRNDGNKYLEDVSIVLKIPADSVLVMDQIHEEPISGFPMIAYKAISNLPNYYPMVSKEEGFYIVQENIGVLKHQQYTEAFNENLRVFFGPKSINKSFTWSYTIYAKNLPNPISGELTVEVV